MLFLFVAGCGVTKDTSDSGSSGGTPPSPPPEEQKTYHISFPTEKEYFDLHIDGEPLAATSYSYEVDTTRTTYNILENKTVYFIVSNYSGDGKQRTSPSGPYQYWRGYLCIKVNTTYPFPKEVKYYARDNGAGLKFIMDKDYTITTSEERDFLLNSLPPIRDNLLTVPE